MSEKLVPFDWDAFVADPSRARHNDGLPFEWVDVLPDRKCMVVKRAGMVLPTLFYLPNDEVYLRLVHKPKTVKVRLFLDGDQIAAASNAQFPLFLDGPRHESGYPWVSDIVEIEVQE